MLASITLLKFMTKCLLKTEADGPRLMMNTREQSEPKMMDSITSCGHHCLVMTSISVQVPTVRTRGGAGERHMTRRGHPCAVDHRTSWLSLVAVLGARLQAGVGVVRRNQGSAWTSQISKRHTHLWLLALLELVQDADNVSGRQILIVDVAKTLNALQTTIVGMRDTAKQCVI